MRTIIKSFLLLIVQFSFSQEIQKFVLDNEYFLLGSTNHTIGQWKGTKNNDFINSFYASEKPLLLFHYNAFKKKYQDLKIDSIEKKMYFLKSSELTKKINLHYNWTYDSGVSNEEKDSLFFGILNPKTFKTYSQKISFLLGTIIRDGKKKKNTYYITIINNPDKFNMCLKILKEVNCRKIKTKTTNNIPISYIIYFEPSKTFNIVLKKTNEIIYADLQKS
ncbi:MAG: hypothetical protein QM535_03070 [Limnohabitans sp.]|nr:hypothetical protein [Limnohabitans sp.]